MPATQFDTLRYVETLTAAGVPEPQAKADMTAFANALGEWGSGVLATRSELKGEMGDLRSELKLLKWMNVTVVAAIVSYVSKSFF